MPPAPISAGSARAALRADPFLDTLEARTFQFFWRVTDARTGLAPDRAPSKSFSSVAAIGFALTSYPIGSDRGYVTRAQAAERALVTLEFLWSAPQGAGATGVAGYKGFFYHFLDMQSGRRFETVELSTIDSAILFAGALACREYFTGSDATESRIRALADSLYLRADWQWAQPNAPAITHGWSPEKGFIPYDWRGYNEAMLVYVLALGSPRHPATGDAWREYTTRYQWGRFQGQEYLSFGPLFGHQYSHVWIDFRGIRDDYMRARGIDYFENSRRATYAQQRYGAANPMAWRAYSDSIWGFTASDGPGDTTLLIGGARREFHSYWARGAGGERSNDDGTIAPTAPGGSIAFAPEIALPALKAMRRTYGDDLFSTYGFLDAFNPTFVVGAPRASHAGRDTPRGWFDSDYLGIDQGPILVMTDNFRDELIWSLMKKSPYVRRGLAKAGFTGGWLTQ